MQAVPVPSLTASPALEACKAFGHLAGATSEEQTRRFLDHAAPWVEREPNHYRHTDAAHAEALIAIAGAHPALRPEAVSQMCRALIAGQCMAQIVLSAGAQPPSGACLRLRAVRRGSQQWQHLRGAGNVVAGTDPAPAVPAARKMLDAAATPRTRIPGHTEFTGGWQETASLTRVLQPADRARLGDAMTAVVTGTEEPGWNRQQALAALATVGRHLSDADRQRLFPAALQAAGAAAWTTAPRMTSCPADSSTGRGSLWGIPRFVSRGSLPPPRSRTRPTSTSQSSTSHTSSCRKPARIRRTALPRPSLCCQLSAGRSLTRALLQHMKANHNARCLAVGHAQPKDPAICHAHAGSRERAYLGRCRRPSQCYRLPIPSTSADQRHP